MKNCVVLIALTFSASVHAADVQVLACKGTLEKNLEGETGMETISLSIEQNVESQGDANVRLNINSPKTELKALGDDFADFKQITEKLPANVGTRYQIEGSNSLVVEEGKEPVAAGFDIELNQLKTDANTKDFSAKLNLYKEGAEDFERLIKISCEKITKKLEAESESE